MAQQLDWMIVPDDLDIKTVVPGLLHRYDLYNLTDQEALVYAERPVGINLRWTDPEKSSNVRFQRSSDSPEPLRFEEPVAINIRGGKWLVYQKRRWGINLGWSDTPKFEWKIMGGKPGDVVSAGVQVGLFSTVENDFVMYESRDYGINLKWYKDEGKYRGLVTDIYEIYRKARAAEKEIEELVG